MSVHVKVLPHVMREADAFVRACYEDSRQCGLQNAHRLKHADVDDRLKADLRGKVCEWAWRSYLNALPMPAYETIQSRRARFGAAQFKAPDIAPDIEVKCVDQPWHGLQFRENDDESFRFALSYFDEAASDVTLLGWQFGSYIKEHGKWWPPDHHGCGVWRLRSGLLPPSTICPKPVVVKMLTAEEIRW